MRLRTIIMTAGLLAVSTLIGHAQVPDLTAGGQPEATATTNLGPTGLRGWVYHLTLNQSDSSLSRQILITEVDSGSPAAGVIAVGDVILGANGTGAAAVAFTSDARKSFALAIADAEARNSPTLSLRRWRAGTTSTVNITLRTMGAYTSTAPYNCPKSTQILQEGVASLSASGNMSWYSMGVLPLLASGNSSYATQIQNEVHSLILSQAEIDVFTQDEEDPASGGTTYITWPRGHRLIVLAEYYLATGDQSVLPSIEAYAINIAKNQSLFGTMGHRYADRFEDGSNGPMGGVYGAVNSAGLPCFYAMLLAQKCGITDADVAAAVDRTSIFYSYYAEKGAIPYGEHEPFAAAHESNGKSGLAALAFSLQSNRVVEGKFFTKMAVAAAEEREIGHTGSYFNFLWSPLGANVGGEEAAAAHFSRISWHLDLLRNWDGSFDYDCLNGEGPDSGETYHNFEMSTAALLTYAMPLRNLHMTGKDQNSNRWLHPIDTASAVEAGTYNASTRHIINLKEDLGHWSPKIQILAAEEIAANRMTTAIRNELTGYATDTSGSRRIGACKALGNVGDAAAAATLANLLTDSENHVRFVAAEGLSYISDANRSAQLNKVLSAVTSTANPLFPLFDEDPMQMAHGRACLLLFNRKVAFGPSGMLYSGIDGVDRNFLFPAMRAAATTPVGAFNRGMGQTFQYLTEAEVFQLSDIIIDSAQTRAPADKMFTQDLRTGALQTLLNHRIPEGVPLAIIVAEDDGRGSVRADCMEILEGYAGAAKNVTPDPGAIAWLTTFAAGGDTTAQAAIDAINANSNPFALQELKTLNSFSADSPSSSTVLRASASDIANGDLDYTWRQVSGPSSTITKGNTTSTLNVVNEAGAYNLELTVSDSRGLTEVSGLLTVDFGIPAVPGNPPTIYEPFSYSAGALNGEGGNGEVGLDGTWTAHSTTQVASGSLSYGSLPVFGSSIGNLSGGVNRFGGSRAISSSALAGQGLLDDGSTLWFSVVTGLGTGGNANNSRLSIALANDSFSTGNYDYWIQNPSGSFGAGFGMTLAYLDGAAGRVAATRFRDLGSGDGIAGNTYGSSSSSPYGAGQSGLVVGKYSWGANGGVDTLELFQPDANMNLGNPVSTLQTFVNQDTFDTLTFSRGDVVKMDEIRFGDSYDSVITSASSGLVAQWSMNDGSGTVVSDDSGNNFNATASGTGWVGGVSGSALSFNGSNSRVTLPSAAFASIDDEVTISMWVYGDASQARNDSSFWAENAAGNRVLNIHLPWRNGQVYWDAGDSGSSYNRINKLASSTQYEGKWNHWVFVKNATTGTMAIYNNGILFHSGTGKGLDMSGITHATFGAQRSGMSYDGLMDEVNLYNKALTASEVSSLYNSYPNSSTVIHGVPISWLTGYGIAGTDAGALADTDGDGRINWQEYAAGGNPLVNDNQAGIRSTEYYLTTGDFTGTETTLTLDNALAANYFILVRGSRDGNGLSLPNSDYARVTAVTAGVGDMYQSGGSNTIKLTRSAAAQNWEGVVTVVECLNPGSTGGFKMLDILSTNLSGTSGTDTSVAWSDINQVTLFGGYRGGGANFVGAPTNRKHGTSLYTRVYPSGNNTLNWTRNAGGETLYDAVMTTFVIEWGHEWNVQRVNVAGSAGGGGANATGEYVTSGISAVSRNNSWVWGTGTGLDSGIGDCAEACLVTLGNGVAQNNTESTVAVGAEYTDARDFDVYVMTHPDLAVDYRYKVDSNSVATDVAVAVDSAVSGARFGLSYNGCNGTGDYFPRPRMWARYTANGTITISRGFSGQNFPAWIQGIDFSSLNN